MSPERYTLRSMPTVYLEPPATRAAETFDATIANALADGMGTGTQWTVESFFIYPTAYTITQLIHCFSRYWWDILEEIGDRI